MQQVDSGDLGVGEFPAEWRGIGKKAPELARYDAKELIFQDSIQVRFLLLTPLPNCDKV
jgi:hypothetical protein